MPANASRSATSTTLIYELPPSCLPASGLASNFSSYTSLSMRASRAYRPVAMTCALLLGFGMVGCAGKLGNRDKVAAPVVNYGNIPSRYQVQSGDTVSKIANRYGLNWRDISALNKLDDNHTIYKGQWLTLHTQTGRSNKNNSRSATAKSAQSTSQARTRRTAATGQNHTIIAQAVQAPKKNGVAPQPVALAVSGQAMPMASITQRPVPVGSGLLRFSYPVGKSNPVARRFGTPTDTGMMTEGIFFAGKEGDTIKSAGSGSVIHADVNVATKDRPMVIIQHDNGYVSSYYDVKNIQVRTGDSVSSGQKLGNMAAQTASGLALFEFRIAKSGSYIDPVSVLH